jgi:hypothetical protein
MTETIVVPTIDKSERKITFAVWQDVEDIIENNKKLQAETQNCDWGRHVASIPNVIMHQWLTEEWNKGNTTLRPYTKEFDEIIARKLADPNWRYLRTDNQANQFNLGWRA